jgi:tetratricopeptide (TPR) repeat protein
VETGRQLMKEGKLKKAHRIFLQALSRLPEPQLRARLKHGNWGMEIVVNRFGKETRPLNSNEDLGLEARLALADCCLQCGRPEEGIQHLEQAAEVCPEKPEIFRQLGKAYESGGRNNLAMSSLRRALRLAPECPEYYLDLAGCFLRFGYTKEALRWLRQATRKFPQNSTVREMLADLYLREGDFKRVLEQAEALLKLNPRNPHAYDLMALYFFQKGDTEGAMASLRKQILLDPLDTFSRLKLALLLQQKGQLGQAMEEFQNIASLASEQELHHAAQEAIAGLDQSQMEQILMRAAEDKYFRSRLRRDAAATLNKHGYRLTEAALEFLQQLELESESGREDASITYH